MLWEAMFPAVETTTTTVRPRSASSFVVRVRAGQKKFEPNPIQKLVSKQIRFGKNSIETELNLVKYPIGFKILISKKPKLNSFQIGIF